MGALVLVVDQSPLGAAGDALEATLAGALSPPRAATRVVRPDREGVRGAARRRRGRREKAKAWLSQGLSWGEALVRLHAPVEAPASAIRAEEGDA